MHVSVTLNQLAQLDLLQLAWKEVHAKGSSGGIDGQSVKAFAMEADTQLQVLSTELLNQSYLPYPYQVVKIPKGAGEWRTLGLPAVRDKVVQQGLKLLLEPILEPLFLNVSYGYRPGKSTLKAVRRVQHMIRNEKRRWLTRCDIHNFFDTISHDLLLQLLQKQALAPPIIDLIQLYIQMGRIGPQLDWQAVHQGIPQGNIISPLLANLYLHELDVFLSTQEGGLVRYADDFVILTQHEAQAHEMREKVVHFLEKKLQLTLNAHPPIQRVEKGFLFLGLWFQGHQLGLSPEKHEALRQDIAQTHIWLKGNLNPHFVQMLRSLRAYYGKALPPYLMEPLDEWMVRSIVTQGRKALEDRKLVRKAITPALFEPLVFLSDRFQAEHQTHSKRIVRLIRGRQNPYPETEGIAPKQKIRQQERLYRKKAAEVRELLISTPGVVLGKSRKKLVVKQSGKVLQSIPLAQLDNVTIQSAGVSLSSNLVFYAAKAQIAIEFLKFDGSPYAKLISPHSSSAAVGLAQLEGYQNGRGADFARRMVDAKIRNQQNLMKYFNKHHRRDDLPHQAAVQEWLKKMDAEREWIKKLTTCDIKKLRGQLFSAEGRAAQSYWAYVQELLSDYVPFPKRSRRGAKDPVNAALNYGYGILYGRMWESLIRARLNAGLSYLHSPDDDKPSLSFDLIEAFRAQAVDRPVFSLFRRQKMIRLKEGKLTQASRRLIATAVLERLGRYERFRGKEQRLHDIIMVQGKELRIFLEGGKRVFKPYIGKW